MADNNNEFITAYRSLDPNEQLWRIKRSSSDCFENALFGGIVLECLNSLHNILNKSEDIPFFDKETLEALKESTKYWKGRYYDLVDAIMDNTNLKLTTKYRIYEEYKTFVLEISDYTFKEDHKYNPIICREVIESGISFKGFEILKNELEYEVFTMPTADYLFSMDLWNIFFQKNLKLHFKRCAYCNDFIGIKHGNQKYCQICKEIVNNNNKTESNQKRAADVIESIKKRITDRFKSSQKYAGDRQKHLGRFEEETLYIEARLNGVEVPYNPDYNNTVKTKDQYREWLIEYENRYRIYKKKQ